MKPNPTGETRNPFHVFLFVIAALNGFMLAVGVPTSSAINEQLPSIERHVYGAVLLLGAGAVLAGMFWPGETRDGILTKRLGYVALTVATVVYSVAVVVDQPGAQGFLAASITGVFSLICAWSAHRLSVRVNTLIVLTQEISDDNG